MKKILISAIILISILGIIVISCSKSPDEVLPENMSLVSPSGVKIASSMDELKSVLDDIIFDKFAYEVKYDITKIEYLNSTKGFFAIISFITTSGDQSNVIYCREFPNKINYDKSNVKYLSSLKSVQGYSFSCSGPDCCKVHAVSHPDGTVDIDCSCSGCTMSINAN